MGALIKKQPEPLLKPIVVKALAWLCERAHQQACSKVGAVSSACRPHGVAILWHAGNLVRHQ